MSLKRTTNYWYLCFFDLRREICESEAKSMRFSSRSVLGVLLSLVALAAIVGGFMGFQAVSNTRLVHAANGNGPQPLTKMQKRLMSSMALAAHDPTESDLASTSSPKNYFPTGDDGC